ncbi:MAG: WYL domain-containing protein [Ktedonobacteraceae bacterium]|nr:WYL domain-containing protein [Ktedonobacteraceae bacterium]
MPISDAYNKTDRLYTLQMLFWKNPGQRLRTPEIAQALEVSESTARRYLDELAATGRLPLTKEGQLWVLAENAALELPAVCLTAAESTALFVSARMLSQIHDERNSHVIQALLKLVQVMPPSLAAHQRRLVDMARERQQQQPDRSGIFEALALGWTTQHQVRLLYTPSRGKTFECVFEPYLLEPSGIGRTIYVIGRSTPPGQLRTFKLEHIDHAELLKKESFEIPADFDGPALLKRAWGVMYGDEACVEVRLRFTSWVENRLKETLWHPSQQIIDTPEGCELTVQIGDMLEIENWIRGWGADCEVLAPAELREKMRQNAHRLAHMYGVLSEKPASPSDEPDTDLFSHLFGG